MNIEPTPLHQLEIHPLLRFVLKLYLRVYTVGFSRGFLGGGRQLVLDDGGGQRQPQVGDGGGQGDGLGAHGRGDKSPFGIDDGDGCWHWLSDGRRTTKTKRCFFLFYFLSSDRTVSRFPPAPLPPHQYRHPGREIHAHAQTSHNTCTQLWCRVRGDSPRV